MSEHNTTDRTDCRASGWVVVGSNLLTLWCIVMAAWGRAWPTVVGVLTAAGLAWMAGAALMAWVDDKR